ncbi:Uncharacterized protein Rs2_34402 [Raphanus sativus]|nr:Uncharacterized protein Rs2_34402 [Raphanus sativus]
MAAAESMDKGRADSPAENIVDQSEPNSMVLDRPIAFVLRAFSQGWNESVEPLSVLPGTQRDLASICSILKTAAYTTGRCIGRYVLSKYGYEKEMAMEELGDFLTCGRF